VSVSLLLSMAIAFATTAIVSVGGISAMIPEIHRQVVMSNGWLTDAQFATAFALSQMAPGPNIMIMSLLGWRIAGLAGLTVATLATVLPTSLVALIAGRAETRLANARWYKVVRRSFPPIVLGLIVASGLVTAQVSITRVFGVIIAIAVTIFVTLTRTNPLVPLSVAIAAGVIAGRLGFL
jgi:chromate transporter